MAARVNCDKLYGELHVDGRSGVVQCLYQALQCGLPNETDWAFRCLEVIAYDGALLGKLPNLLDLMLRHTEFFLSSAEIGKLLVPSQATSSTEKPASLAVYEKFFRMEHTVEDSELDVFGLRLVQIAGILFNLSCEKANLELLGNNKTVVNFIIRSLAAVNAKYFVRGPERSHMAMVHKHRLSLHARSLELLSNIGAHIKLVDCEDSGTFLVTHLCNCLASVDRARVRGGLRALGCLAQLDANQSLLESTDAAVWNRVGTLLLVPDVPILLAALELLFQISSGSLAEQIVQVPRLVHQLVRLLKFDLDCLTDVDAKEPLQSSLSGISYDELTRTAIIWLRENYVEAMASSNLQRAMPVYEEYLEDRGLQPVLSFDMFAHLVKQTFNAALATAPSVGCKVYFHGIKKAPPGHHPKPLPPSKEFADSKRRRTEYLAAEAAEAAEAAKAADEAQKAAKKADEASVASNVENEPATADTTTDVAMDATSTAAVATSTAAASSDMDTNPDATQKTQDATATEATGTSSSAPTTTSNQAEEPTSAFELGLVIQNDEELDRAYGGGNFPCPNMAKCGKKYRNLNGLSYHLATSTCARESAQSSQRTSLSGPVQQNIMAADRDFLQMIYSPKVAPGMVHVCEWASCFSGFSTRGELITHVGQAHIGSRQDFMRGCGWQGCSKSNKPLRRAGMISHLHVHFCKARLWPITHPSLKAKPIAQPRAPLPPPPGSKPPVPKPAAAQPRPKPVFAVERSGDPWSGVPWQFEGANDINTVNGVRLGAALVLRNLAGQPETVAALRRYEADIALMAMSSCAVSDVLAGCLAGISEE